MAAGTTWHPSEGHVPEDKTEDIWSPRLYVLIESMEQMERNHEHSDGVAELWGVAGKTKSSSFSGLDSIALDGRAFDKFCYVQLYPMFDISDCNPCNRSFQFGFE